MLNISIRSGRVVADAVTTTVGGDKQKTTFSLAVNYGRGDKQNVSYFDCLVWGNFGAKMAQYLKKGTHIIARGHDNVDAYEKDGQKRKSYTFVVDEIDLLGSKRNAETAAA